MRKKLLFTLTSLALLFCLATGANAQGWFVGGGVKILANDNYSTFGIDTHGGYEFNDHWAIGGFLGEQVDDDENITVLEFFGRYTPWHNDVIYLDLKGKVESSYGTKEEYGLGILPSLRFRIVPRWEVFADFGYLGVRFDEDGNSTPLFAVTNRDAIIGITFKF